MSDSPREAAMTNTDVGTLIERAGLQDWPPNERLAYVLGYRDAEKETTQRLTEQAAEHEADVARFKADVEKFSNLYVKYLGRAETAEAKLHTLEQQLIQRGQSAVTWITGDPEDADTVIDAETAWKAIDAALQLGQERNNERNVLEQQLAELTAEHDHDFEAWSLCSKRADGLEAQLAEMTKERDELRERERKAVEFGATHAAGGFRDGVVETKRREAWDAYQRTQQEPTP